MRTTSITAQKINPKHQKPKLSLFSRPTDPLQRPQTAPASLLPLSSLESTHRRPQPGFTSGYMSRSLAISLQETEPLSTSSADWSRTVTPCHMQDRSSSTAGKPGRYDCILYMSTIILLYSYEILLTGHWV